MKRKALRILNIYQEVLIRSASDDRYPLLDPDKRLARRERGHWIIRKYIASSWRGLHFESRSHFAFIADDGKGWDYAETMNDAEPAEYLNPWSEEGRNEARAEVLAIWEALPEANRAWFNVTRTCRLKTFSTLMKRVTISLIRRIFTRQTFIPILVRLTVALWSR
jgi:hypothetical protein